MIDFGTQNHDWPADHRDWGVRESKTSVSRAFEGFAQTHNTSTRMASPRHVEEGCPSARHSDRVSHLVLYGAYARGWQLRGNPHDAESRRAMSTLMRLGWGTEHPTFRQLWTSIYIPEATTEQWEWFNEMQRISTSAENAARLFESWGRIDVTGALPNIRVPTIVFHCERDGVVPFEEGRLMASVISGAQFVPLPSRNHLVLADEPAWKLFLEELGGFLGWQPSVRAGGSP